MLPQGDTQTVHCLCRRHYMNSNHWLDTRTC